MVPVVDIYGPQHCAADGTQNAIPVRKHPAQQFLRMGQLRERLVRRLTQLRPGIIKFATAVWMKKAVGSHKMRAFLGHMAQ